jgi:PiT family inorganic phosphate transporter/sulfate permease
MISPLVAVAAVASAVLALNIGANNTAAEMGPAFGAGARSRRQALVLIAVFCTVGALLAGGRVLHTVGHGLITGGGLAANPAGALVVVVSSLCLIACANALRVPVSTAHVVVGSVVGLGLFYGTANLSLAAKMVGWWVVTPVAALVACYLLGRTAYPRLIRAVGRLRSEEAAYRVLGWSLTLSGCWMAFSAGTNSLAKAMGPAVGAGIFVPSSAALVGGLGMASGALLFGSRTLNTVGKEITRICPICAVLVETVSASIVFVASRFGMPVSLAEIVTCSVIGFSFAANGLQSTAGNQHVRRIALLWPAAPAVAAAVAFGLLLVIR